MQNQVGASSGLKDHLKNGLSPQSCLGVENCWKSGGYSESGWKGSGSATICGKSCREVSD